MRKSLSLGSVSLSLCCLTFAHAEPQTEIAALFAKAEQDGRVGLARKTKPVDVRPARLGEVIVTVIVGEGKETQCPPAQVGDMVVRNRCPETGNEEILVQASKFTDRYEGPTGPADAEVLSGLAPLPLADAGSVGYRARLSQRGGRGCGV